MNNPTRVRGTLAPSLLNNKNKDHSSKQQQQQHSGLKSTPHNNSTTSSSGGGAIGGNKTATTTTTTTTAHHITKNHNTNSNNNTNSKINHLALTIPQFKSPQTTSQRSTTNITSNTKPNKNQPALPNNNKLNSNESTSTMGSGKPSKIPKPSKTFIETASPTRKLRFESGCHHDDSIFKGSRIPRPKAQTFIQPSSFPNIQPTPPTNTISTTTTTTSNSSRLISNRSKQLASPQQYSHPSIQAFHLVSPLTTSISTSNNNTTTTTNNNNTNNNNTSNNTLNNTNGSISQQYNSNNKNINKYKSKLRNTITHSPLSSPTKLSESNKHHDFSFMDNVTAAATTTINGPLKLNDDELIFKLCKPTSEKRVHNDRYSYETLNHLLMVETPSPNGGEEDISTSSDSSGSSSCDSSMSPIKKTSTSPKELYFEPVFYHFKQDLVETIRFAPLSIEEEEYNMISETLNLDDELNIINHQQQDTINKNQITNNDGSTNTTTTTTIHNNNIDNNNNINNNNTINTINTINNNINNEMLILKITDLPIYMEIYNFAREGKEIDLFKKLIHLGALSTLVQTNLDEEPSMEVYEMAYAKFLSRGVFAKLIVKDEILTLNSIEVESGNTALHAAINENHISTASLLCKCKRMINQDNDRNNIDLEFLNIDQYNYKRETPLHISVLKNFANVAHLLLQNGSRAFELKDSNGNTALQLAAIYEREAIAHSICEHGGDVCIMYSDKIERISTINTTNTSNSTSNNSTSTSNNTSTSNTNSNTNTKKVFDRFGFPVLNLQNKWTIKAFKITEYVSIDMVKQPLLFNELYKRRIKEESRLKKWNEMLKEIREHHERGDLLYLPKKFKERVRKGIPNQVRGEAWFYLSHGHVLKKQNPNLYSNLKQRPLSMKDSKQIDVDIKREFREHSLYAHRYGKYQVILFNLLRAYCNYNSKLGYTQGMSSIAAMLLMYLDEEDAFWVFCSIMEGQNYNMQEMYFSGLPGVYKATFVLSHVLSKRMKKFTRAFENEDGIGLTSFCTRWYMLNMLTQIHFDIAVLIWDLYLSEGRKVIHSVALAFVRIFKKQLIKLKYDGIITTLSKLLDVDFDLERLMRKILVSKIREKTIRSLEAEYDHEHGHEKK